MDKDTNPSVRNSSKIFKSNIFYLAEYREILLSLLIDYNEIKFSDRCLKDIVESTHVFLKLLESFCTSRSLPLVETVRKKHAKKKVSALTGIHFLHYHLLLTYAPMQSLCGIGPNPARDASDLHL
jgi:timeless